MAKRIRRDAASDDDPHANGSNGQGKARAARVESEEDETAYARGMYWSFLGHTSHVMLGNLNFAANIAY